MSQSANYPKRPNRRPKSGDGSPSPWQQAQQTNSKRNSAKGNSANAKGKARARNNTRSQSSVGIGHREFGKPSRSPNTQWQMATEQGNTTLTLHRYPADRQHVSLQAWDAADELLIHHLRERLAETPLPASANIVILNDDFGALACALLSELFSGLFNGLSGDLSADLSGNESGQHILTWQSDSYIAKQGCLQNLAQNQLPTAHITLLDSMTPLPDKIDLALIKLPRSHALLEHQLASLQHCSVEVIAAGKVKSVQTSVLQLFERYLGTTTTSLAVKKARLIFSRNEQQTPQLPSPYPTIWKTDAPELILHNHANVFSRAQLDIGARLLLDHLPDCNGKTVIDLGCGNGVLGLRVLQQNQPEKLLFVDESAMAIASAQQNVAINFAASLSRCDFVSSDCLSAIPEQKAHVVLCNPPFHQQNTLTDHIAWQMFQHAQRALYPGGELRVVANRHLQHYDKLKRLFGGYQVVASDQKFSILSAINK